MRFLSLILIFLGSIFCNENLLANRNFVFCYQPDDTTKIAAVGPYTLSDSATNTHLNKSKVAERNAIDFFQLKSNDRFIIWNYNKDLSRYNESFLDTNLTSIQLNYPQNRKLETFTYLGNIGSPTIYDHYFSRSSNYDFLFSRHYNDYMLHASNYPNYKLIGPLTTVQFSNAGNRREAEEILRAFHSQNANSNLNFGMEYKFIGTKGVYQNQKTRNTSFAFFSNYCKANFFVRAAFTYNAFKHNENGGIINSVALKDTIPSLVAVYLKESTKSNSDTRMYSFSTSTAYSIYNRSELTLDSQGKEIVKIIPLVSALVHYNYKFNSRVYLNNQPLNSYFENTFISPLKTRDSVNLISNEIMAELDVSQFRNITGIPGIKFQTGIEFVNYYYFKPNSFIYNVSSDNYNTYFIAANVYSSSSYLKYFGRAHYYFFGNRANDKELFGEVTISPWANESMPKVYGYLKIADKEPDVFLKNYFSNHFYWVNSFEKERHFLFGSKIQIDKIGLEAGYNIEYINNYLFFNTNSAPQQDNDLAITSLWAQSALSYSKFNIISRFVWQLSSKPSVVSLPTFIAFSSLFYKTNLVENALDAQFGISVFYRSSFYASAYNPATGQFYNQQNKLIGNYPYVDLFINLKWKRALIFIKYEHINQGMPDYEYYVAFKYPFNPRIIKYGISWSFYD